VASLIGDECVIDKIGGSNPIRTTPSVRRVAKAGGGDDSFARQLDETEESGSGSAVAGTNATNLVTNVLGLQEVDDATAQASRGKLRAENILDQLDDLKMSLLAGTLSKDKLLRLVRMVNSRRAAVSDPRLSQILDEIDLRAQVELAKYGDA
jgi:hypothetical protein